MIYRIKYCLNQACPGKSVVKFTDRQDLTIAVDWDVKPRSKQKQNIVCSGNIRSDMVQILKSRFHLWNKISFTTPYR